MSPTFVNDKSHPVRVSEPGAGPNGAAKLRRIVPGQTISADGAFADALEAAGLPSATDEQEEAYEARRHADGEETSSARLEQRSALGSARTAIRHALVAAPLRRVVGDDQAPFGPPSGTVTTKGAVVEGLEPGDPEREAFAQNEAVPGEKVEGADTADPSLPASVVPTSPEIHNAQVENAEAAEEIAQELVSLEGGNGPGADHGQGKPDETEETEGKSRADLLKLAKEQELEVHGTGAKGRVSRDDLVRAFGRKVG